MTTKSFYIVTFTGAGLSDDTSEEHKAKTIINNIVTCMPDISTISILINPTHGRQSILALFCPSSLFLLRVCFDIPQAQFFLMITLEKSYTEPSTKPQRVYIP